MNRAWAVLSVIGLLITACSGDDDAAPSTVIVTTTPDTTAPRSTVLVTEPGTTEAATTTVAPTTTQSVEFVRARDYFDLMAENTFEAYNQAAALAEPTTAAWQYAAGLAGIEEFDTNPPAPGRVSESGETIKVAYPGGQNLEFSNFIYSQNGLLVDFARNGVPISADLVGSGQEIPFTGGNLTVVDFRMWDGNISVEYLVRNDNAEFTPSLDTYVVEGRQYQPDGNLSLFPSPLPGATQPGYAVFAGAPRGGVITGFSPDGEITIQVPA